MGTSFARSRRKSADTLDVASPLALRFTPVATILKSLTREKDSLIFSVTGSFAKTELSSGRFDTLALTPLPLAFEALARPLAVKIGSVAVVDIDEDARIRLNLTDFPDGSLAFICLEAERPSLVYAAIFESKKNGGLSPDSVAALQATARLSAGLNLQNSNELMQMRSFYRRFTDVVHQCFWVLDLDSAEVLKVSDNFETIWGAQRSVLMTGLTGFMSNVMSDDRGRLLSEFHTHLESDCDLEFRVLNVNDASVRWLRLRTTRFEEASRPDRHLMLLIAEDVTEKKNADELERAKEADLVSRARALAVVDLASGVAHEINNPLTIIVGRASELKRRSAQGELSFEVIGEFTDKIQSTAVRIADIIKSLKSLSRQDRGADFTTFEFSRLAREVLDLSSERFKAQSVDLQIDSPPDALVAEVNPTLISQVVLNLVNNALDAVSELSEKWVRVDFTDDADSIYIGVTDSGSGIPIKIRNRIFDPFFTTKSPGKGTGLGLSLSMSIAAHHDGALRLDTLHQHTRFVLQIPKRKIKTRSA